MFSLLISIKRKKRDFFSSKGVAQWSMKWVEHHEILGSNSSKGKLLGDLFSSVLVFMDRSEVADIPWN